MNGKNTATPAPGRDHDATPVTTPVTTSAAADPASATYADADTAAGLVGALLDAARAVSSEVEARAGGAKMTVAQALLARHFAHNDPGIPMTELAARSGMTAPAVTRMLQRMTQKGLVRRSESPTDGRAILVRLTASGLREYRAISARLKSIDRGFGRRATVHPEDLARILASLTHPHLTHSRPAPPPSG